MYYCAITLKIWRYCNQGASHNVFNFTSRLLCPHLITIGEHGDLQNGSRRGHPGRPPLHHRWRVCLQRFPWRWHHVPRSSWMLQSSTKTLEPGSLSRCAEVLCISGRPGRSSVCTRWDFDDVSSRGFRLFTFPFYLEVVSINSCYRLKH